LLTFDLKKGIKMALQVTTNNSTNKPIRVVLLQPSEAFGGMAELPISLVDMAAVLLKAGIETEIFDARLDNLSVSQTIRQLQDKKFDVVGITGLNNAYRFIKDFSFEFKRNFPTTPLIAGGLFIMFEFERILKRLPIDVACIAEGEEIILDLVNRLATKQDLDGIKNIAYLKDGAIVKSETSWIENFEDLPIPAYELLDMNRYLKARNIDYAATLYFPITTGRGCVHHCYFCGKPGKKVRRPSAEKVLAHMDYLNANYGITAFRFSEDSAFYPREFLIKFSKLYLDGGRNYKLAMSGCPEQLNDEELIQCVAKMGVDEINVAVEHWNPDIQKAFYRVTQSKHILDAWKLIKKYKLQSFGFNILWGHPKDTAKSFRESYAKSIEMDRKHGITNFSFAALIFYPNSSLLEDALKTGKILDYEDYMYACGGYGPYVNLTQEDDDVYRAVIVEMRYMQEIELAYAKLKFLLLTDREVDLAAFETLRNDLTRLITNVTLLRQIIGLPQPTREQFRQKLEVLLDAKMYNPNINHYHEIACFSEILHLPKNVSVAVFGKDSFVDHNVAKLFNSAREAGIRLVGFIEPVATTTTYEGLPLVSLPAIQSLSADYIVIPGNRTDTESVRTLLANQWPGIKTITISKEAFAAIPWQSNGLNGWYDNPDYWKVTVENNSIIRKVFPKNDEA